MSEDRDVHGHLRRHLHDIASLVDVGEGSLRHVRDRASARVRRQRMAGGAVGVVSVVAVVGISVSMLASPSSGPVVVVAGPTSLSTSIPSVPDQEADAEADDGQGSSGALVAEAQSVTTTTIGAIALAEQTTVPVTTAPAGLRWVEEGPSLGGDIRYEVTDAGLVAMGDNERLLEDGDGWRALPSPPGALATMEFAVDVAGSVRLVGMADSGGCAATPTLVIDTPQGWAWEELPVEPMPGFRSELKAASAAATTELEAVSLVEEMVFDPHCALEVAGRWGSDPVADDTGIAFLDEGGDDAMVTWEELADLGIAQPESDRDDPSMVRAKWLVRRPGDVEWSVLPGGRDARGEGDRDPAVERLTFLGNSIVSRSASSLRRLTMDGVEEWPAAAPIVVRPGAIVGRAGDGTWLVWTQWGEPAVSLPGPALPDGATVLDAVPALGGVVVVYLGPAGAVIATPTSTTNMRDLGIDADAWARLASDGDRVRLVTAASGVQVMLGMHDY